MATVPNRYYNSPWIEAAGRNLAAALAPEDPTKKLEEKRMQWMLDREMQNAQYQDEERARVAQLRGAFGDLATSSSAATSMQPDNSAFSLLADVAKSMPAGMGQGAADTLGQLQTLGSAVTGQTKDDATRRAYQLGASPEQVYSVTGQKAQDALELAGLKNTYALALQGLRNTGHLDAVNATQAGLTGRSDAANALKRELNLTDNQFDYLIQLARNQGGIDAANARGNKTPPLTDISPSETLDISDQLAAWGKGLLGVDLPADQLDLATRVATDTYQTTRNAKAGMEAGKKFLYGSLNPTVNPGNPDPWGPNNWMGFIGVKPTPASIPLRGGMTVQQLSDEYDQELAKRNAPPAAAPAGGQPFSSSFNFNLPGLLPQGNLLPPGMGQPPPNRVRVDAQGNVIR